ncbi:AAA family ATPase [Botrimarina sp.]|uniref:AAA family ATPase n=1 Tax=Botrimarina sp. TaxID=2795802 RepID=UPI0032EC750F
MGKRLLVVGGPNGAGKTTLARAYLASGDWLYLGADEIAKEMSPQRPESASVAAGREFVERLEAALNGGRNLLVESTLSGRSIGRNLERARQLGFSVEIAFTFVDAPETSIARVAHRVRVGGHHVPSDDVRRRFFRSIRNFWQKYREQADYWTLADNRSSVQRRIAIGDRSFSKVLDREAMAEFIAIVEGEHV